MLFAIQDTSEVSMLTLCRLDYSHVTSVVNCYSLMTFFISLCLNFVSAVPFPSLQRYIKLLVKLKDHKNNNHDCIFLISASLIVLCQL